MIDEKMLRGIPQERMPSFAEIKERFDKLDLNANITRRMKMFDLLSETTTEEVIAYENEIKNFDEDIFNEVGVKKIMEILNLIESDMNRREELIAQFKQKYEEANQGNIVQRYFNRIYIPNIDHGKREKYDGEYFIKQCYNSLSEADLDFLAYMDPDELRCINQEFELLLKKINPDEIKTKEEELNLQAKKEKFKGDKQGKELLINQLANAFLNNKKLLIEMADYLNIKIKTDNIYDRSKLKNIFQNFNIDTLKRIESLYSEVSKITTSLGGNVSIEEDLVLGLEELRGK